MRTYGVSGSLGSSRSKPGAMVVLGRTEISSRLTVWEIEMPLI